MSLLATIDALHRELDAHPDAHDTRRILADALEDAGGEWAALAPGYRALAALRRRAACSDHGKKHLWWFYRDEDSSLDDAYDLLPDWFDKIKLVGKASSFAPLAQNVPERKGNTRREVEDAAALAFSRLSAERRAELLCATRALP